MEHITSRTNALITRIRKLVAERKHRRREGVMVCEGPKMLGKPCGGAAALDTVVWEAGKARAQDIPDGVRQVEVAGGLAGCPCAHADAQGVLFLCQLPERPCRRSWRAGAILCWTACRTPATWGHSGGPPTPLGRTG